MATNLPPDKVERTEIDRVLVEANRNTPAFRAKTYAAFADGQCGSVDRVESWVVIQLETNPEWKEQPTAADAARAREVADLERVAFTGKDAKAATARQMLHNLVGGDEANAKAIKAGLSGIGDFSKVGTVATADDKTGDDKSSKDEAAKNPWRDDSPAGMQRRIAFIKSVGTRAAAGLAKAAHRDLAGRPLR